MLGKKMTLALLCAVLLAILTGCATVNSDNSFQEQAPTQITQTQAGTTAQPEPAQTAPAVTAPAAMTTENTEAPQQAVTPAMPTRDPNGGING